MPSNAVHHTADCPEPITNLVVGSLGDTLERCRNCRRFAVVSEPAAEVKQDVSPALERIDNSTIRTGPPAGGWVCGNHDRRGTR